MIDWLLRQLHSLGEWAVELAFAIVVCLVAYPVIRIGSNLRLAIRLGRLGHDGVPRRSALRYAALGSFIAIVVGGVIFEEVDTSLAAGYFLLFAILVLLGWFGFILVPEEFGDE
jgi:hypothetical protein